MLLTSRVDEYAAAVRSGDVLTAAAVVTLEDLGVAELAEYLPRTHKAHTGPSKWMPVVDHLRAAPGAPLTRVLSTPLMVALARTIFSDTDADPAELLEVTSESELEQRLLAGFVPAVYSGIQEHDVNAVHRWLRFLATHLNRQMTYDLAWWRLVFAVPRAVVGLVFGLTMMGLVLLNFVPIIMAAWPGNTQQVWLAAGLETSLVVALV